LGCGTIKDCRQVGAALKDVAGWLITREVLLIVQMMSPFEVVNMAPKP
jgi:hypothetical protein